MRNNITKNASTSKINEVFIETKLIYPLCVHSKSPSPSYLIISKDLFKETLK